MLDVPRENTATLDTITFQSFFQNKLIKSLTQIKAPNIFDFFGQTML